MNYLNQRLEDMASEEQGATVEYVELAEDLFKSGMVSKQDAIKILNIARDEQRHFETLRSILRRIS
jgi:rubrerythrin